MTGCPDSSSHSDSEVVEVIARQFDDELDACDELLEFGRTAFNPWQGRPIWKLAPGGPISSDELIVFEFSRSQKTFGAVVELARIGYGEQGGMLDRALFEAMAVAHWVHAHPEQAVTRFADACEFDAHLWTEAIAQAGWTEDIDAETVDEARLSEPRVSELQAQFGRHGERPWVTPRSLYDLVSSIQQQWDEKGRKMLWQYFHIAHRDNNQLLHSTTAGLQQTVSAVEEEGIRIWAGPSNVHIERVLFAGHWNYGQMLSLVLEHFEFPGALAEPFAEMLERHMRAFSSAD